MYDLVLKEAGAIVWLHSVVEISQLASQLAREGTYND
jgi:hypothetical protein